MPRVAAAFVTRSSYMVLVSFPVAVGKYSNMDFYSDSQLQSTVQVAWKLLQELERTQPLSRTEE